MRSRAILAALAGALVILLGICTLPSPPRLAAEATGDAALIQRTRDLLAARGGVDNTVSVTVIEGEATRSAEFGADRETAFEIGSITKTLTAALLAEAIRRGEVRADTRLGELLDLGDSPASRITLESLAMHTSGLPRLPATPGVILSAILSQYRASDPYHWEVPELIEQARAAKLSDAGTVSYSNFGVALLGQGLAAAADTDYRSLLTARVLEPLGMTANALPLTPARLPAHAPTGVTAAGRAAAPWTMHAYAPAGGLRATATEMTGFTRALLDGTAPGIEALEPRAEAGEGGHIGLGWFITPENITWHNGGTGGYSSFIALDRSAGRAVIILSSAANPVDDVGIALLGEAP
ncbi:serine hydrolase domain-containing protein [Mycetocola spongiae]|uniref:serine hydrolase domain-containing protein n=1 Tax=Mycetocola spongiae TaxID=2859226 RepID=UPI001CF36C37|nr:serine hydrolase domain-containing protein [Mycetocola spongiae]UCR88277.1 beta-lactamase family protein [Mycetocola spongiae]